jgi:hypothetical protein
LEIFDCVIEVSRAGQGFGIRVEMLQQEKAERHNSGQLMELSQDESPAQTNRQRESPFRNCLTKASRLSGNLKLCNNKANYRATPRKCKTRRLVLCTLSFVL